MNEQLPYQIPPYSGLAAIYDQAGFAAYVAEHVPRYIRYAQSRDWAGRRILDLGCGTGVSTWWLSGQGFRTFGIDRSAEMLAQAEAKEHELVENGAEIYDPPTFVNMDIRRLESPAGEVDMVLAAGGVLNAIQSLRDVEDVFAHAYHALGANRWFVFDMLTIKGLAEDLGQRDEVVYDNGQDLLVMVRNRFSYETLGSTRHYTILHQEDGRAAWQRQDEIHHERSYPAQGIAALLERIGFRVMSILTPDMTPYDHHASQHARAVFFAQK